MLDILEWEFFAKRISMYLLILGKVGQNLKFPALVELMKKLSELGVPHGQFLES